MTMEIHLHILCVLFFICVYSVRGRQEVDGKRVRDGTYVCVCVCVCVRERDREVEREKAGEREQEREETIGMCVYVLLCVSR